MIRWTQVAIAEADPPRETAAVVYLDSCSPNGKKITVSRFRDDRKYRMADVYTMNVAGTDLKHARLLAWGRVVKSASRALVYRFGARERAARF